MKLGLIGLWPIHKPTPPTTYARVFLARVPRLNGYNVYLTNQGYIMGKAFSALMDAIVALVSALKPFCSGLEQFGHSFENIGIATNETSGTYLDEVRTNRAKAALSAKKELALAK